MIKKNYVDELLTKYGRFEPQKKQPENNCPYCSNEARELTYVETEDRDGDPLGFETNIYQGKLITAADRYNANDDWIDINYCPMCGRDLRRHHDEA